MNKEKLLGQTFTETSEINNMINMYKSKRFIDSKILEPSFGSGHFLQSILRKMIYEGREKGYEQKRMAKLINDNLHGYEIDSIYFKQAIKNLKSVLIECDFHEEIKFSNLKNTTAFSKNNNHYDLIIGNPPYVRIQNFDNGISKIKDKLGRTSGNTDLFLMFIDFFLEKMEKDGQFIFIVPNSFGKSKSAKKLRDYMYKYGSVDYFDFEDAQLFPSVSVYSCVFNFKLNDMGGHKFYTPELIKNNWRKNPKKMLNNGYWGPRVTNPIKKDLGVKNGVATLSDSKFIYDQKPDSESVYRVYKGSRSTEKKWIIFPYKLQRGKVTRFKNELEFKNWYPKMYKILIKFKDDLANRSLEKNTHWFEFGRSQAINDIANKKILINTLIKPTQKKLEIKELPKNTLVYSGLYSIKNDIFDINDEKLIKSLRFKAKDMRGGYKKISSSLLKHEK